MKKTGILIVFLWLFSILYAQKNDSIVIDSLRIIPADTLNKDSVSYGDVYDLLNDEDLKPMDSLLTAVDSLQGGVDSLSSLKLDMVMPDPVINDSLSLDSLGISESQIDTLVLDSLVIDSTVIDTLKFDSAFYHKQQEARLDSMRKDSIRLKKLAEAEMRRRILPSVRELNNIFYSYRKDFENMLQGWYDYTPDSEYGMLKPEFFKYVVPLTYYSSAIQHAGSFDDWEPEDILTRNKKVEKDKINAQIANLQQSKKIHDFVEKQLLSFYISYPELVQHNENEFQSISLLSDKDREAGPRTENIMTMIQPSERVAEVTESDLTVYRPNFWTTGGNGYLHFSQNHISDNWYKGGESTKSMLSGLVLFANFNDKQRIQFENRFEWKLGFITAPSDTVHSYKANNDLLRLTSKFGLKAVNHWYYTLSMNFKTQLFSNYRTNSDDLISAFFSPAELNIGLGMDYKYNKNGICNLSLLLNPFNYTLYSIMSDDIDPTKFNIDAGHKHQSVFGSRLDATLKWKMFQFLMWESRLSYTTNYEKVLAEWENTFTFVVNKYLSTKLFVHGRFDDGVKRKEGTSYFQVQEILSFGLNYTW